jgi:uncharacterized protein YcbK (DUF882 family)
MSSLHKPEFQGAILSRRRFIKLGVLTALAVISPCPVSAAIRTRQSSKRFLSFYNIHTEELLKVVYWANGKHLFEALVKINHLLRDYRTGEIKPIEPRLLDLLYAIRMELGANYPFHLISGYRSPETNALLCDCGREAAKNSFHIRGKAADIRLPGCRLSLLRRVAMDLGGGGVGYYPHSDFIHVDVGPIRYWCGL